MKLKLNILKWSNVFSYGDNNTIDLSANPLTQLVGKNGNGKSSIPLILELVLFNKNSKNVKTSDIINRYSSSKKYHIGLTFEDLDKGDNYSIDVNRASTQTVKFQKNGTDISAHTATATFKLIEDTIGFSHKEFIQLIYQESASSLEFLTATDSSRKKFLIDLLDLNEYTKHFDTFKEVSKKVTEEVKSLESKMQVVNAWLDKNLNADLTIKDTVEVPVVPDTEKQEVADLSKAITNIVKTNKAILDNNKHKEMLDLIDLDEVTAGISVVEDVTPYIQREAVLKSVIKDTTSFIASVSKLHSNCPTCKKPMDNSEALAVAEGKKTDKLSAETELAKISEVISNLKKDIQKNQDFQAKITQYESLHSLIDTSLSSEILSKAELEARVVSLKSEVTKRELDIAVAIKLNSQIEAANAVSKVIASQMADMQKDLSDYRSKLTVTSARLNILTILQKAFSTNGLPAYKIENLIKDLEETVNEYLTDLSSGRFQLAFVINGEKLNVVITDNGFDIDIMALSKGELARVNCATLLAIRQLMQKLSNVKLNLLILDETIENFDLEGKEKFIEVLLGEDYLNTFIISHSFSHPLLEKINIVKENNISRIDNG